MFQLSPAMFLDLVRAKSSDYYWRSVVKVTGLIKLEQEFQFRRMLNSLFSNSP